MLKFKLFKLKQACASFLLPRLLLKSLKYPNEFYYNRTVEHLCKVRRSTTSKTTDSTGDNHLEKETRVTNTVNREDKNIITPEFFKEPKCEICEKLISILFKETDVSTRKGGIFEGKTQATTSKHEEEKLAQKIEIVEETPHVEAHAPKVEGFNATPKVLGHDIVEMSKRNNQGTFDNGHQIDLDELAKRCMGAPVGEIDRIVFEELKNAARNKTQLEMDVVRNQYDPDNYDKCNDITTKDNYTPFYDINVQNESRLDNIRPTHLDSVPLLTLDTSSNDYKMSSFIKDYPAIVLTKDVDEPPLDGPAPLSPYEKPAIPFYEYINKENIKPDEDSKIETTALTETDEETEIIINDETLQRRAIEQEGHEGEVLHPKPTINQYTVLSGAQRVPEGEEAGYVHENLRHDGIFNVLNSQHLFTSNPEPPTDWQPHQNAPHKYEPQSSSISSAHLPGGDSRTLELPSNTSISANQNPEEYYKMSVPGEFLQENEKEAVQRLFAECPVAQNIIFSALPQIELEEVSKKTEEISDAISHRDSISHMVLQPGAEREYTTASKIATEPLGQPIDKDEYISAETAVPLSLLLRRVRERNRLEYCRNIFANAQIKPEGTKKFACPPPVEKNKSKTSVKPCQPKPKPACEPCKPTPCPAKKDPCAKFLPIFLTSDDAAFDAVQTKECISNEECIKVNSLALIIEKIVKGTAFFYGNLTNNVNFKDAITYARDFDPWIPIPSWPIPKKEKSRPFVCPKEGCKVPVARTNKPCKEKQCDGLSKKSFALSQVFSSPVIIK